MRLAYAFAAVMAAVMLMRHIVAAQVDIDSVAHGAIDETRQHSPEYEYTDPDAIDATLESQNIDNDNDIDNDDHRLERDEYLDADIANRTCHQDRGVNRGKAVLNKYMNFCSRHKLEYLLSNEMLEAIRHNDSATCFNVIKEFIELDEVIKSYHEMFKRLLKRYNCHNGYSVKWTCEHCKVS